MQVDDPLKDCELLVQARHVLTAVAPTVVEYVLASQLIQVEFTEAPVAVEYLPAAQSVQSRVPFAVLYLPAAHWQQVVFVSSQRVFPALHEIDEVATCARPVRRTNSMTQPGALWERMTSALNIVKSVLCECLNAACHFIQFAVPITSLHVPVAHAEHVGLPSSRLKFRGMTKACLESHSQKAVLRGHLLVPGLHRQTTLMLVCGKIRLSCSRAFPVCPRLRT